MSERILIPLDGSKLGEAAVSYVDKLILRLAPDEKVEITLLHVITEVTHAPHMPAMGGGGFGSIYRGRARRNEGYGSRLSQQSR